MLVEIFITIILRPNLWISEDMNKYVKGVDRYTFAKITPYDEKVPGNQSSSMYMSYVFT